MFRPDKFLLVVLGVAILHAGLAWNSEALAQSGGGGRERGGAERGQAERGGRIGGGGPAMACFSIPVEQAIQQGFITPEGRRNLVSAEPLEYFLIKNGPDGTQHLDALVPEGKNGAEALEALMGVLKYIKFIDPAAMAAKAAAGAASREDYFDRLTQRLEAVRSRIGLVSRAVNMPHGFIPVGEALEGTLHTYGDASVFFPNMENCGIAFAVVRRNGVLYRDRLITDKFTPVQMALIQLHEELAELFPESYKVQDFLVEIFAQGKIFADESVASFTKIFGRESIICRDCAESLTMDILWTSELKVDLTNLSDPTNAFGRALRLTDPQRRPRLVISLCPLTPKLAGEQVSVLQAEPQCERLEVVFPIGEAFPPREIRLDGAAIGRAAQNLRMASPYISADTMEIQFSFRIGQNFVRPYATRATLAEILRNVPDRNGVQLPWALLSNGVGRNQVSGEKIGRGGDDLLFPTFMLQLVKRERTLRRT